MTNAIWQRPIVILGALRVVAGCGERPVAPAADPVVELRELVGAVAMPDRFDAEGEVIDGASIIGPLAVGVPGTVAGMQAAHQRFATLPWAELLEPTVQLAAVGFEVPAT